MYDELVRRGNKLMLDVTSGPPHGGMIGNALDNTGLASGVQQLTCVGAATPIPNWTSYRSTLAGS